MFTSLQYASFAAGKVKKTPLYDFHVRNHGNVVEFCGWALPVGYKGKNITETHLYTRSVATLFDVSHMGQLKIHGKDRYDFIESLSPGNIKDLKTHQARLTQLTNENGGIIDDTIITKKEDYLFEIINAATTDADLAHFRAHLADWKAKGKDVDLEFLGASFALVALQGPKAHMFLQELINKTNPKESDRFDLKKQVFMTSYQMPIAGQECRVSRLGYTGEDGFEIAIPAEKADEITEMLINIELKNKDKVLLAGLGPRDTLRLEAGLCLMGQDMTAETTPIEANLSWTIGKRRKQEMNFPGAKKIMEQLKKGINKKRVGFIAPNSKITPRTHHKIFSDKNKTKEVGEVTSGSLAPCLGKSVGMCYIHDMGLVNAFEKEKKAVNLFADVRGKTVPITLASMPFFPQHYYRGL